MPLKRRRTPQEKKRLSYAKDRRDGYGEHNKGSRKNVSRNKSLANRTLRKAGKAGWAEDPDAAAGEFTKAALHRFRKSPHISLREKLEAKQQAKQDRQGGRKRRALERKRLWGGGE